MRTADARRLAARHAKPGAFVSPLKGVLEPARSGPWTLERVVFPQPLEGFEYWTPGGMRRMRVMKPMVGFALRKAGAIWMSDTPMEVTTAQPFVDRARGDALEVGLGIGLTTVMLRRARRIRSLTVVEREADVAAMVWPQVGGGNAEVVLSSFEDFARTTPRRFDAIHVDVWPTRELDPGVTNPVRDLARGLLKPGGFVYVWLEELTALVEARRASGATLSGGFGEYPPCFCCGKSLRHDYLGLCMDCADLLRLSDIWRGRG